MNRESNQLLGKKILGAVLSYKLGNKSVDYVIKKYLKGDISEYWGNIGWELLIKLLEEREKDLGIK